MGLKICLYEDESYRQFFPITCLRPVYALRPGILPIFQKVQLTFDCGVVFAVRESIAALVAEQRSSVPVNIIKLEQDDILFLNGRIREFGDLRTLVADSRHSILLKNGDDTIGVLFKAGDLTDMPQVVQPDVFLDKASSVQLMDFHTTATLYSYLWEFVSDLGKAIVSDYKQTPVGASQGTVHDGATVFGRDNLYLASGAEVLPGAVIDATSGPVHIGANTRVEPQAAIYGPAHVGPNSTVLAGKLTHSSIGHTCRVGGEVEESIFHSYVNKYHAGFIGHSFVGSWVNFGAMTTNSDLKNNYSAIRVSVNGKMIDSGEIKVGSFIGDHTKFGIGTLLNTGINIGVCCNIFGGGLVTDKEVAAFSWGSTGNYDRYDFSKAIETATRTAERRGVILSEREAGILRAIHDNQFDDAGVITFG